MDWTENKFYSNFNQFDPSKSFTGWNLGADAYINFTEEVIGRNAGPMVRSPSTILISEDGGSSFNLAQSE